MLLGHDPPFDERVTTRLITLADHLIQAIARADDLKQQAAKPGQPDAVKFARQPDAVKFARLAHEIGLPYRDNPLVRPLSRIRDRAAAMDRLLKFLELADIVYRGRNGQPDLTDLNNLRRLADVVRRRRGRSGGIGQGEATLEELQDEFLDLHPDWDPDADVDSSDLQTLVTMAKQAKEAKQARSQAGTACGSPTRTWLIWHVPPRWWRGRRTTWMPGPT